jgi:hypothetical protein
MWWSSRWRRASEGRHPFVGIARADRIKDKAEAAWSDWDAVHKGIHTIRTPGTRAQSPPTLSILEVAPRPVLTLRPPGS